MASISNLLNEVIKVDQQCRNYCMQRDDAIDKINRIYKSMAADGTSEEQAHLAKIKEQVENLDLCCGRKVELDT